MNLYYDSEFTGLTQHTSLISIALISDDGHSFYAEFTDYSHEQIDDWLRDNVLAHCRWIGTDTRPFHTTHERRTEVFGDRVLVTSHLRQWLAQCAKAENPEKMTIWADCYAWDWVLFAELFGGAFGLPEHIHYMPGDLSTLFRARGLDPDTDREAFANMPAATSGRAKHNALWDAEVLRACYHQLMHMS